MKLFARKRDESEFVEYGFGLVNEVGIDRVNTEDSTLVDLYYWSEESANRSGKSATSRSRTEFGVSHSRARLVERDRHCAIGRV